MILTDSEIRSRLGELEVTLPDGAQPFDDGVQVKSCSIDLRLSPTIWVPRRFRTLDLSLKNPWGAKIAQAFNQRSIPEAGYVLRPGQFILGRTFETFRIPNDLAGRLAGRSSIGRLGISVVAPSNLINPAWQGHMPLMLINHAPYSVRLYSGLSVVQLFLCKLTGPPATLYGPDNDAKYSNDDGGPSKYWLDWSMKLLKHRVDARAAGPAQTDHLARVSAALDEPTRRRFARALGAYGMVSDTSDFIEYFARRERGAQCFADHFALALRSANSRALPVGACVVEYARVDRQIGPIGRHIGDRVHCVAALQAQRKNGLHRQ